MRPYRRRQVGKTRDESPAHPVLVGLGLGNPRPRGGLLVFVAASLRCGRRGLYRSAYRFSRRRRRSSVRLEQDAVRPSTIADKMHRDGARGIDQGRRLRIRCTRAPPRRRCALRRKKSREGRERKIGCEPVLAETPRYSPRNKGLFFSRSTAVSAGSSRSASGVNVKAKAPRELSAAQLDDFLRGAARSYVPRWVRPGARLRPLQQSYPQYP